MLYWWAKFATLLLVTILLSQFSSLVQADSDSQRLSTLSSLKMDHGAASSNLITFDIDSFEEYVESAPRSYHIFVLFTADPSMCVPCAPMRKQLQQVAMEYENLSQRKKSSKPTFFAELKISASDQMLLQKYGIRHVPLFYVFQSSSSRIYPTVLRDGALDNYPLQQRGMGANQLKEFVNARVGSKLTVVRGGYPIPFKQKVRDFMPVILMSVALAVVIAIATEAYKNPMVWFGLVVLVYIFSVGGGHFSWIHNTPLAYVNQNGGWQFFANGSRSQYVAEGFFVSATCVSISVLVILIQEMPTVIPNKANQAGCGMVMITMTMMAITTLLVMYQFVSSRTNSFLV